MNARARRKRTVLRIRWRQQRIGLTDREMDILEETKLFRTLRCFWPEAPIWMIRQAVRIVEDRGRERVEMTFEGKGQEVVHCIVDEVPYGE